MPGWLAIFLLVEESSCMQCYGVMDGL